MAEPSDEDNEDNEENIEKLSFEDAMSRLEEIVKRLEEGDLSLEDSLDKFEYGIKLSRFLHGKLRDADRRISELVKENGELLERPASTGPEGGREEEEGVDP